MDVEKLLSYTILTSEMAQTETARIDGGRCLEHTIDVRER